MSKPKTRRLARILGPGLALVLSVGTMAAPAAGAADSAVQGPSDAVPTPGTSWQDLDARAEHDGTVPVIVGLRSVGAEQPVAGTSKTGPSRELATYRAQGQNRAMRQGLLSRFKRRPAAVNGLDGAPFVALHVDEAQLDVLRQSAEVASVSVDQVHDAAGTSSYGDADGQQLPALWDYGRIGADWANNNGWTGRNTRIAVIDTGVDRTNPYLSGKVSNEACFATYSDGTGACAGGAKWVYSATAAAGITGAAAPCSYNAWSCSHGTHVAHTAAGTHGIARGATVIAIQASHREWDATRQEWSPRFNDSDMLNALWYVHSVLPKLNIVAAAVNMSIGGTAYTGYCDSTQTNSLTYYINLLKSSYQIPVVISSGNGNYSNGVGHPACNSTAISVGNTTLSGNVDAVFGNTKYGSNSNATLDLLAPGTDICSAVPATHDVYDGNQNGWTCGWNGTSMAAPHVAGAIAILTQKRPTATVDQLVAALKRSGSTGGVAVTDSRNNITRTRINVANAVYYF